MSRSNSIKNIVFDTNALLVNPELINRFAKRLIMPKTILDELDYRKKFKEHQEYAQLVLHHIEQNNILSTMKSDLHGSSNDEKIIDESLTRCLADQLLLVSNDVGMRNRAKSFGIECLSLEDFLQKGSGSGFRLTPERQEIYNALVLERFEQVNRWLSRGEGNHFNFYLKDGFTPLISCIRNKKFRILEYLLEQRSTNLDMLDQGKLKMPPFCHAAQRRQIKVMEQLLEAGATPHLTAKGKNCGNSPLLIAAWDGSDKVIRYICEHKDIKLSINQADNNGFTPLIKACIKGHTDIVRYLIGIGADAAIRDRKDKLAIDYAKENNHDQIVDMLFESENG